MSSLLSLYPSYPFAFIEKPHHLARHCVVSPSVVCLYIWKYKYSTLFGPRKISLSQQTLPWLSNHYSLRRQSYTTFSHWIHHYSLPSHASSLYFHLSPFAPTSVPFTFFISAYVSFYLSLNICSNHLPCDSLNNEISPLAVVLYDFPRDEREIRLSSRNDHESSSSFIKNASRREPERMREGEQSVQPLCARWLSYRVEIIVLQRTKTHPELTF